MKQAIFLLHTKSRNIEKIMIPHTDFVRKITLIIGIKTRYRMLYVFAFSKIKGMSNKRNSTR
jgi:hypothetical protein